MAYLQAFPWALKVGGDLLLGGATSDNNKGAHLEEAPDTGSAARCRTCWPTCRPFPGPSEFLLKQPLDDREAAVCARCHSQIRDVSGAARGQFHMLLQPVHLRQRPLLRRSRVILMCGCVVVLTCTAVTGSDNARGRAERYMLGGSLMTTGMSPA